MNNKTFLADYCDMTYYQITCDWCKVIHNENYIYDEEKPLYQCEGDRIYYVQFAEKTICECCFKKLETGIWGWSEIIINWLKEKAIEKKIELNKKKNKLDNLIKECENIKRLEEEKR